MGRFDLTPKDKQSIADAVGSGNIGEAVEIANRLIWGPFNKDPEGKRIDWMPMASEERMRALIAIRPRILKSLPDDVLTTLNFAAVMAKLLGPQYRESEWLPSKLDLGLPMTKSAAVNMFHFCERNYEQIGVYSKMGFNKFKIHVCHNVGGAYPACAVCEPLTGSVWTKETIPELPYEKCENNFGCRCLAMADA